MREDIARILWHRKLILFFKCPFRVERDENDNSEHLTDSHLV